jgi:MFS family permease
MPPLGPVVPQPRGPDAGVADVPGQRRALFVLAASILLAMTTWFSASAVIPQLRAAWGLSGAGASYLTVAVQLGFVVGALTSSTLNLSDLVNPRRVFFLSSLGAATVNALVAASHSLGPAIVLRALTGFFLAGVYPPAVKVMASWYRRGRGFALGILIGALTIGSAAPQLINGVGGLHWQVVVLATSVLTAAGGLLVGFRLADGPFSFPRASFEPAYLLRTLRNRAVRLANFGYFGHMWELYSMWAWFGSFFAASLAARSYAGNDRLVAGLATFAVIGAGAGGAALAGTLADRYGRTLVAAGCLAVSGTCCLTIGLLFDRPPLVFLLGLVWGSAVVADSAQFSTIVTEVSDQAYIGTALTVQLALGFLLTTVTIRLIPTLTRVVGWRWAFAVLAAGPLFGIISMLRLRAAPEARLIAGGRG